VYGVVQVPPVSDLRELEVSTWTVAFFLYYPPNLLDHVVPELFPNLTMRNVDSEVAETAADFRAKSHLRPPDAIQIATCIVEGGSAFVTNDERLRKIEDPAIIIMKDYI
jgi:predicted nucleic acid-binding protein